MILETNILFIIWFFMQYAIPILQYVFISLYNLKITFCCNRPQYFSIFTVYTRSKTTIVSLVGLRRQDLRF